MSQRPRPTNNRYVVEEIPISQIDTEEQQVRQIQVDDDIHELASSIDALDLLQFPGVVRKENGRYDLAWGRRRLEAFKLRGARTIPCRMYEGNKAEVKALALVENLQRKSMSIKEECDGVAYLAGERKLSIDQIVGQLGRTRSWVLQRLAVPNLHEEIKTALLDGDLSLGAAEALDVCTDDSARLYILSLAVHQRLTVAEVREHVRQAEALPPQDEAIQAGVDAYRSPQTLQMVHFLCAACNVPRPTSELKIVRVCIDGCQKEDNNGDH